MPNYYYLAASLPMFHFEARPPFSSEVFLAGCRQLVSESDYKLISAIPETKDAVLAEIVNNTAKKWLIFDTQLRNELVRIRSGRRHADPSRYLRPDGSGWAQVISHIALAAHRSPSILEGERLLDRERWNFLTGLELGHYFDTDFLIIYARKLKISERWEIIRLSDKAVLLEGMLKNAQG
jgi:hypothetical protein